MVCCYVAIQPNLTSPKGQKIYALLLPDGDTGEWAELTAAPSKIDKTGFGVFPRQLGRSGIKWSSLEHPVLIPYLGFETVVKDDHTSRCLVRVLRGEFERVTVGDLTAKSGGGELVIDGLFAVPRKTSVATWARPSLPAATELLQVSCAAVDGGKASACYLLTTDVREALGLCGERAYLFELLCAHSQHEHADRSLATHVATVHRKEEGHVLINAHPAFFDCNALPGLVNEPLAGTTASLKFVKNYCMLLKDTDPLMVAAKLRQPRDAERVWACSVLTPVMAKKDGSVVPVRCRRQCHPAHRRL